MMVSAPLGMNKVKNAVRIREAVTGLPPQPRLRAAPRTRAAALERVTGMRASEAGLAAGGGPAVGARLLAAHRPGWPALRLSRA